MKPDTPLHVARLNVRGLGSRKRQFQVKRIMEEKQIDILAVQETKIGSEQHTDTMVQPFLDAYYVCVSHAAGTAGGCCLFIKKAKNCVVESVGRAQRGVSSVVISFMTNSLFELCVFMRPRNRRNVVFFFFFEDVVKLLECDRKVFFSRRL